MSTRTTALTIERSYLLRAWFVVSAVVIAAAAVVIVGLALGDRTTAGEGSRTDPTGRVVDPAPVRTTNGPIGFGGVVCGQCR